MSWIPLVIACAGTVFGARIEYSAITQNGNITGHDWVLGSKMWGSIESGTSTATHIEGFSSLAGLNPSLLTWTFGDLELTSFLEPTADTAGYEIYSESDSNVIPLNFYYGGNLLASGTVYDITVHVANANDVNAAGVATGRIESPGSDDAFFDEIMGFTGGSGLLSFTIGEFYSMSSSGQFGSSGVLTFTAPVPAPEGASTALCLGFGFLLLSGVKALHGTGKPRFS